MGKTGVIKVTTVYGLTESLGQIPKEDWPDTIYRKKSFACGALTTNLREAIDIIEDFEKHEAWKYSSYKDRTDFYHFGMHIEAEDVPRILAGYKDLVAKGERPTHWRQAVDSVQPLTKHGQGRKHKGQTRKVKEGYNGSWADSNYIIARLKRDRPDIAERLANGEFRSVRAAAIEAGINWGAGKTKPLHFLRHYWKKAPEEQRLAFLQEIGARFN